jgi:hypothetical protein
MVVFVMFVATMVEYVFATGFMMETGWQQLIVEAALTVKV